MFYRMSLIGLAVGVAVAAQAQELPRAVRVAPVDFSKIEITTTRHADDFFTLEGEGGTISVLTGPDGVLVVDSQFAPLTDKIVAAIGKVSDQPIRFLINTHVHADHTGGNANFSRLGALIFSRDELRMRLERPSPGPDGRTPPPAPAQALPAITYDGPVTLHVNDEHVQLIPIRAAHTDGDTLVRFPKHDALAVGDYYRSVGYPFIDTFNGGTLEGLLAGLGETIRLAGPGTKIIPGHGAIVDRSSVIAQRDFVIATRDRMRPLVAQGMTIEQVLAENLMEGSTISVPPRAHSADEYIRSMYAELKRLQ